MAIDLITGHQGVAHISAEQIAKLQRAELGGYGDAKVMRMIDGGVTYAGLTITVAAGYWRVNGFDMQIQEAEEILIDPTAAGMNRIDKVYATILQDIPSGVQRSELRVVQGEESASTPTAPTKPTAPILNTDELLQIEEVCTVTVSDGAMTFTDNTIPYELANPEDITDTQQMIAPIEAGPTASQAYAVGKQLVYNGLLYKVTSAIAQGDALTVGTNIDLSDDVTTQLLTLKNQVPKYGTSSTAASTTAKKATTTNGDFVLQTGAVVRVKFSYDNSATTPTLNIDSTGAHNIKAYNTTKPDVYWKAGDVVEFTYDGSNFIMGPTEGQISELNASLNAQHRRKRGTFTPSGLRQCITSDGVDLSIMGYSIGDEYQINANYKAVIADIDTFYGGYDSYAVVSSHHVGLLIVGKAETITSKWNNSDSTASGYNGSVLHTTLKGLISTIEGALGTLISHQKLLTTATSNWAWQASQKISALSECQIYGAPIWSIDGYQQGEAWKQLEVFRKFSFNEIFGNQTIWLRSALSASGACSANAGDNASYHAASAAIGVVGLVLFH